MSEIIIRNTVKNWLFTVVEKGTTTRVDLTALPLEYFLTPRRGGVAEDAVISKVTVDFTLLNQAVDATKGQCTLKLEAAETALLPAQIAVATLFVTEAGDRRRVLYQHVPVEDDV